MSKYSALIKEARKSDTKKGKSQESEQTTDSDEEVNLSIKVPKVRRQHWAAEAKRQGTSLTAVIIEALSTRFGEPE
jgi:predicted HicB family RNase H-like nuclease